MKLASIYARNKTRPQYLGTATKGATKVITMDEAIARAANHVGQGGKIEITSGGNFQFRTTTLSMVLVKLKVA